VTILYTNPCFLDHKTGQHPESHQRLEAVTEHLRKIGLDSQCSRPACPVAPAERIALVHASEYVAAIEEYADMGGGPLENDTIVSRNTYKAASRAVGSVCDAVERVVGGEDTTALCLVRPPGHHAFTREATGFCLFNNIAVAARVATHDLDLDRVLIVDFDIHHGNGTQSMFWEDEQVGFFSIHRWPFYPGSGSKEETGSGAGLGTTVNLPIEYGTPVREQLTQMRDALDQLASKMRPQLLLVSAGFDSHSEDPVGSLSWETEDFATATRIVQEIAATHCKGRLVSVLEGGYNPPILAECVETHLRELLGKPC